MIHEYAHKEREILAARAVMRTISNSPEILRSDTPFIFLAQSVQRAGLGDTMLPRLPSENKAQEWLKRFFPTGTVAKMALSLGYDTPFPFYGEKLDWSFLTPKGRTPRERIENLIIEDIFT